MCGIFGYIGERQQAPSLVLEGLKTLEYRGYDSWGVASVSAAGPRLHIQKQIGKIGDAVIDPAYAVSSTAFGHTRWATHGGVTVQNAHPHLDCTGNLALIQNGIIENYDALKATLLTKGHTFISETDTEVAVHLIEEEYKQTHNIVEAVRLAFNQLQGMNAIIVLDATTGTFIAAKNGSPLSIGKGKSENFLASDAHAMLPYTRDVYFMEDGDIVALTKDAIVAYDAASGGEKPLTFTTLDWQESMRANKGTFAHFMMKEICDQVEVLENCIHDQTKESDQFASYIKDSFGTYLVGCGTAAYACLAGTYLFSKIAKRHVNFSVASEFGYLVDFLTKDSLVVALSQSGETIDVIDAVKKAKKKGASIASLVNVLGSTLYRFSDRHLLLNAGVETAVVSTKAFTAKLAYLILLAHTVAGTKEEGRRLLTQAVGVLRTLCAPEGRETIHALAQTLQQAEHIYVVGRGLSYPIALETALKIKEASYIHAEGFAAGELKHGVIALIEKGTPCIVFLPNDETYDDTLVGAMEMKARGARIIGISHTRHSVFDDYIAIPDCGVATIIPAAVVGQLLGYFLSVARGYDPDKPRNLAKSVTVK